MKLEMPALQDARVLVVGDVMLDRYYHGETSRISPEAPVAVVNVQGQEDRPGGASNVALNLAALGAAATLVGVVGRDSTADSLRKRLAAAGVQCEFLESSNKPTITKLRVISKHQQLLRLDFEKEFDASDTSGLGDNVEKSLLNSQILVLSDYSKGTLTDPAALIGLARQLNIPVIVDPKGTDFEKYRGATLITPNLPEFEAVVGVCRTEEEIVDKGRGLMSSLQLESILITRGENGMTLLRPTAPELHLPAKAQEVYDVTGAGDTVIAVLAAVIAVVNTSSQQSLADATRIANLAAGLAVGKLGTAAISGPELRRAVRDEENSGKGVMSAAQLEATVRDAKFDGERIVFTNGCFDVIHAGHVGYLSEARQLGDRLVVAINGDSSVTRLKGMGRPINPVERRMAVLAGLEAVDWVVSFDSDTPESLLKALRPDTLVKGGDYAVAEVVGGDFVKSYGGDVKVLNFIDDCSTSAIVDRIHELSS
ncbi:MAG: bifunctional D-glycero-beta-D-manno-heptose-7-phosphate kinase/D-glycero-beta-D-manno-heptose 1-phosphate adenylyltransferase HldE [Gammaproteobacteria bacterium]|nr:bifunctional D-glycero-beta-D-manno-heptose-7-phosphate kinase/D-glycero-beta-D-manno-heptose 1-phosphate adenylyltransferase HldE [Gammaproteobacteria bacterium]MDG1952892.1 bifunctional D-glycero-beta-D-manno-heptose-7-phosphate kinase/D-glycero-beta-D-manno-heptose 1-phosphate adenylyltransferase HldE [Gammaproteobacteria bacterium]